MSEKKVLKPVALAVGAALAGSFAISGTVNADVAENPFEMTTLSAGYVGGHGEGGCGGDKEGKDKKDGEGSCGEGSCGGDKEGKDKKDGEGSCGEGSCGGDKDEKEDKEDGEGSCGEGSCGSSH